MFPSAPPILRVVLRQGKGLVVVASIIALLFLFYQKATPPEPARDVTLIQPNSTDYPSFTSSQTGRDTLSPPTLLLNPAASHILHPPTFTPGTPNPPGTPYTKAVVIARTRSEEVAWINDPLDESSPSQTVADEWTIYLYTTDDTPSSPTTTDSASSSHPIHHLSTPLNKGREAMAYLTYIIDHYAALPDITLFMHAHRSSWHDNQFGLDAVAVLRRLRIPYVVKRGYVNLRCDWEPGCPDHIHPKDTGYDEYKPEQAVFAGAWREMFPLEGVPEVLSQACCAQ